MKKKYLLRGIGIGLIIGMAVSYTAFKTGNYVESSSTEATTSISADVKTEEAKPDKTEAATEKATEAAKTTEASKSTEDAKAKKAEEEKKAKEEAAKKAEEEKKAKEEAAKKAEKEKKAKEEAAKKAEEEKKAKEEEKKSGETVEVEITRGMTSERIARTLEKAGVIESASDYDSWLKKNRYSNKLHVGTFTLTKGMSYEDITKELTTKGY